MDRWRLAPERIFEPLSRHTCSMSFLINFLLELRAVRIVLVALIRYWSRDKEVELRIALSADRLVGVVVKASASRAEDPGFESRLRRDFFGCGYPARRLAL